MNEPTMIRVPEDAGEIARRRGVLNPIEHDQATEPSLNGSIPKQNVRVVTLDQFVDTDEEAADPLIGEPDDSLLPADGLLLMYGDGGAGKTTLSIDAVAHLASGTPWLGLTVPAPVRILLIENEGPRGPFRLRLKKKRSSWQGAPFKDNVSVLEEPWTRFTLTDPTYRQAIAEEITRTASDLVVVGPLASLGAKGTGTPDEINEFDGLIADMRSHTTRRFALWIVHHENKQGDVSGAWDRYPDSLVHIQGQGNGRTRINWRKVRWSSSLHETSTNLVWTEGNGFELEVKPIRDIAEEVVAHLRKHGWRTRAEIAKKEPEGIGVNKDKLLPILNRLVEEGTLEYAEGFSTGRTATSKCWRIPQESPVLQIPELQDVKTGSAPPSQSEPVGRSAGGEEGTGSLARPLSETVESQSTTDTPRTGSLTPEPVESSGDLDYYASLEPEDDQ